MERVIVEDIAELELQRRYLPFFLFLSHYYALDGLSFASFCHCLFQWYYRCTCLFFLFFSFLFFCNLLQTPFLSLCLSCRFVLLHFSLLSSSTTLLSDLGIPLRNLSKRYNGERTQMNVWVFYLIVLLVVHQPWTLWRRRCRWEIRLVPFFLLEHFTLVSSMKSLRRPHCVCATKLEGPRRYHFLSLSGDQFLLQYIILPSASQVRHSGVSQFYYQHPLGVVDLFYYLFILSYMSASHVRNVP